MILSPEQIALLAEIDRQRVILITQFYPMRMRVDLHPDDLDNAFTVFGMPILHTNLVKRGQPRVIALDA